MTTTQLALPLQRSSAVSGPWNGLRVRSAYLRPGYRPSGGLFCACNGHFLENFMSLVVVFHQASEIVPVADEFTITNEGEAALFVELPDVDLDELP